MPKFSDFTAGVTPTDTDQVAGILSGGGSGSNRRWTWDQVWTYVSGKVSALYAPLASPTFTGTPAAPTAAAATRTTQVATTAFVVADRFRVLAKSAVAVAITGTVAETVAATIAIPAGAMGPNGIIRVTSLWSVTNNANAKTIRYRLGGVSGTQFLTANIPSVLSSRFVREVANRNAQNSQVTYPAGVTGSVGPIATAVTTMAVDTSAAQDIVIAGTLGNSADTMTLESYMVEIAYGA